MRYWFYTLFNPGLFSFFMGALEQPGIEGVTRVACAACLLLLVDLCALLYCAVRAL